MKWLIEQGFAEEVIVDGQKGYRSTHDGNMQLIKDCKERREQWEQWGQKKDSNSIQDIIDRLSTCWISLETLLPENAVGIKMVDSFPTMQFCTVLVKDDKDNVAIANRILCKKTGNLYLNKEADSFDWHWSNLDFIPTHWMPMPR
jgi:hypothetical protein